MDFLTELYERNALIEGTPKKRVPGSSLRAGNLVSGGQGNLASLSGVYLVILMEERAVYLEGKSLREMEKSSWH